MQRRDSSIDGKVAHSEATEAVKIQPTASGAKANWEHMCEVIAFPEKKSQLAHITEEVDPDWEI